MAEILKDAEACKTLCPACKRPLYSAPIAGNRYVVWCPRGDCHQMADGPNEGGYGKTPEKALAVLMAKLGISKDYEIESEPHAETETETAPEPKKADKPAKKGKRGRKPKNENQTFIIPVGEFTMKEFCEKNETYPYKALPFFKEKGVEEVGFKKTSSGRGKPAVLYEVKI